MKKNLYEILEVSPDADQEQIKASMIRLGRKYAAEAQKNRKAYISYNQIKEAYKILSNPYRRTDYDNALKRRQNLKKDASDHFKTWIIEKWQVIKKWPFTQQVIKRWYASKQWVKKKWPVGEQRFVDNPPQINKLQTIRELKVNKHLKGWKIFKPRPSTKYIRNTLIPGEKILYQTYTYWFFSLDLIGVVFFLVSSYLIGHDPLFLGEDMPTVSVWVPWFLSEDLLEISVWRLGLTMLLFVALMVIWEAFVNNHTTELVISSKRVIYKRGLLHRIMIDLKLGRFESITIDQSLWGRIFDYGTLTISGVGCVKTTIPHIVAPLKFKKRLWQILEEYGGNEFDENSNHTLSNAHKMEQITLRKHTP